MVLLGNIDDAQVSARLVERAVQHFQLVFTVTGRDCVASAGQVPSVLFRVFETNVHDTVTVGSSAYRL
jgi:hypothetical protein